MKLPFFQLAMFICAAMTIVHGRELGRIDWSKRNADEDTSAFDKIEIRNAVATKAEEDAEKHKENPNKYLLKSDASVLKKLSEGDILLDEKDKELLNSERLRGNKRSVTMFAAKLWHSRVIPFTISHEGTKQYNTGLLALQNYKERFSILQKFKKPWEIASVITMIEKSLATIASVSCLKFRYKTSSDKQWIAFTKGSGCYSGVGRRHWETAPTVISLGDGCIYSAAIEHEVLHALGFFHEQSRPDRDSFVTIHYGNVAGGMASQFSRHVSYDATIQNTKYDYTSIMHYGNKAFSSNGNPTMEAKFDKNQVLGGNKLSQWDILELNKIYQCTKDKAMIAVDPWSNWSDWTSNCFKHSGVCSSVRERFCMSDNYVGCNAKSDGVQDEYKTCPPANCTFELLQPHWGQWSGYTSCTKTCGDATKSRERKCDNPPPNHGLNCVGNNIETVSCQQPACTNNCTNSYDETKCFAWAVNGECIKNPAWMGIYCCKACRDVKVCTNIYNTNDCITWSSKDECTKNQLWMTKNCCRACNDFAVCKNTYDESKCIGWASTDECNKNTIWMWKNCCKACKAQQSV